ncbi:MAG: DUF3883 domain-containing protein, partial [Acidobacteria bacterium]|nr:DUF3883 domain-containing protein [Acidobacteriota bacterium]
FKDFAAFLTQHFDWVVLDTPPVMAVTDASITANLAHGVLFVVGAEMTSRRIAQRAVEQLELELRGEPYNKADHRRVLRPLLNGRSDGAVELKHQNISAVLQELHHPWINGYKPRKNYQQLLAEAVVRRVGLEPELERLALATAETPWDRDVHTPAEFEDPPAGIAEPQYVREPKPLDDWLRQARIIDYFARETRNRSLGAAGEEAVVAMEQARLIREGQSKLADRVEQVSKSKGDGTGFDVLSFEASGRERFIEVKTTSFAKETPFHVTRSERDFSYDFSDQYQLYRLFTFRKQPRVYRLEGALERSTILEPTSFLATPRS